MTKRFLPLALAALVFALSVQDLRAQQVTFRFVAPTDTIISHFGAAAARGGYVHGYRGVAITAANLATFTSVAPPNVVRTYEVLQPGTTLRDRVDRVLQISGGKVDVEILLVDDRTGLGDHRGIFATVVEGGQRIVWPAASGASAGCASNDYCGLIRLGEQSSSRIQTRPGNWLAWEGTILHESLHTQFVDEKTKWSSILITYGADHAHWRSELLGDQHIPFEEGLGTFYGSVHNPAAMSDLIRFFGRTDERYELESRSVLAGTAELWNAPHVEEERAVPESSPQTGRYLIRSYKWKDVPGFYLLFSESTSTMFHGFFWKYTNGDRDQALEMIQASASSIMWRLRTQRDLMFAVNRLAQELEVYAGTNEGQAAKQGGTLTSGMFPFALLDLLTHYGMSEARYREVYEQATSGVQPRSYQEYWRHRDAVKALAAPHLARAPIAIDEAVLAVHRYFQAPDRILLSPLVHP